MIAHELARAAGPDEAIRLDAEGRAAEGATCNLFAVVAGEVVTPPVDSGALPGVVRARALATCAQLGAAARERPLPVQELVAADEVFVTSSLRGVVPVTRIDLSLIDPRPQAPPDRLGIPTARFSRGPLTDRISAA